MPGCVTAVSGKKPGRRPPPDPPGPHNNAPADQERCVIVGRTLTGDTCTVITIRDGATVVFYPHGAAGMGVRIQADAATKLGRFLLRLGAA